MYTFSFKSTVVILAAVLACANRLYAQTPDMNQLIAKDPTVTIGKLSNGLTYYIKPNKKPAQKVELRLVLKSGSLMENDDQQGLAHFMEHMEFNGLRHYPKNQLVDYLQKIGVQFGADLNASTGWDMTYYMLPIPTDKPGNLENGFQILGDWAGGALITTEEVDAERSVILEELRMRDKNANTRALYKALPSLLNRSRYASRMPSGLDSIVAKGKPELIRKYYRDWYRPDLMAVVVVGDITVPAAKALIKKYFSALQNPAQERLRVDYPVEPYATSKAMVLSDPEIDQYGFVLIYTPHKRKTEQTVGDFRDGLIRRVFETCLNKRLRDMTQSSSPPYISANASLGGTVAGLTSNDAAFEIDIRPLKSLKGGIDSAVAELLKAEQFGFNDADLIPVKNDILASYEQSYNERDKTPSSAYTDVFANSFMKGEPLPGITNEYTYVKEFLPKITAQDVNELAKKILSDRKNYFALFTGPQNGNIDMPTDEGLLAMVKNAFGQKVTEPKPMATAAALLEKEPIPGKIVSEKKDAALGTTTYSLSNGIRVVVKPTNFQNDDIQISAKKFGGTGLFGPADKLNSAYLTSIVESMGYGQFTPTQLSDYLSGKNIGVYLGTSSFTNEMSGSSTVKDLPSLFQLVYLKLTSPRRDTSLFRGFIKKIESQVAQLKMDPANAFQDSLNKVLYHNDSNAPVTIPSIADIDALDIDRILEIYRDQFCNADGFSFVLVGNINEENLKPLLEKYIASLPVTGKKPMYHDNGLRMVSGERNFNYYGGIDPKSSIIDIYHGELPYSEKTQLEIAMLAQVMTIKVIENIREKMGAIYSGGVMGSLERLPYSHYTVIAKMPCGPENVDKIQAELAREVEDIKRNGVSQIDLDKVKKALTEKIKEVGKFNIFWCSKIQDIFSTGYDENFFLHLTENVNNITPEDIKNVAQKVLTGNCFKAVSYPKAQ